MIWLGIERKNNKILKCAYPKQNSPIKVWILLQILLGLQSRAFVDVVEEWFGQIVPKIGLNRGITQTHSWVETVPRIVNWN
jgi:hypothetical protein